jgi:hypothetical protein
MISINHFHTQSDKSKVAIVVIRCDDKSEKILSVKHLINEYINHLLFILHPGHTAMGSLPFLSYGNRVYKQIYRSKEPRPLRAELKSSIEKFMIDQRPISKEDHDFGLKSYISYESNLNVIKRKESISTIKKHGDEKSPANLKSTIKIQSETKSGLDNLTKANSKKEKDLGKTHIKSNINVKRLNIFLMIKIIIIVFMKLKKRLKIIRENVLIEKKKKDEIAKIEWPTIQDTKGFTQKRAIRDAKKQYEYVTTIKYHKIVNDHVVFHEEVISTDKSLNTVSQLIRHEIIKKLDVLKTHPIEELSTRFIHHKRKLITILWTPYSGDNRNILIKLNENVYFENPPTRYSNWLTIIKYHENRKKLDGSLAINVPIDGWSRSSEGIHNVYGKLTYTNYSSQLNL